jgi:hypothetical protein
VTDLSDIERIREQAWQLEPTAAASKLVYAKQSGLTPVGQSLCCESRHGARRCGKTRSAGTGDSRRLRIMSWSHPQRSAAPSSEYERGCVCGTKLDRSMDSRRGADYLRNALGEGRKKMGLHQRQIVKPLVRSRWRSGGLIVHLGRQRPLTLRSCAFE